MDSDARFEKVRKALRFLGLTSQYLHIFQDNTLGDSAVQQCIEIPLMADTLEKVISNSAHRTQFITMFRVLKTDLATENQQAHTSRTSTASQSMYQNTGCPLPEIATLKNNLKQPLNTKQNTPSKYLLTGCSDNSGNDSVNVNDNALSMSHRDKYKASTNHAESIKSLLNITNQNLQHQIQDVIISLALQKAIKHFQEHLEKIFSTPDFLPDFEKKCKEISSDIVNRQKKDFNLTEEQEKVLVQALEAVQKKYEDLKFMKSSQTSVAIGIDLGTTYSCAAVYLDGKTVTIPNEFGKPITPSWVRFNDDDTTIVGEVARQHSRDPLSTIFHAKRMIGRRFSDEELQKDLKMWPFKVIKEKDNDIPKILVHERSYFAEEISARVLHQMKVIAENFLGRKVTDAVVTVPAYFNNGQRQATKDAGEIAGLNILKIINEPTAAAIAYKLHRTDEIERNVLIFDLGGGTFDVAVLCMVGGEVQIKAVGGDTHLGGQDFDSTLVNYFVQKFEEQYSINLTNICTTASAKPLRRIWNECENQKCNLSSRAIKDVRISLDAVYSGHDLEITVTKKQFEDFNQSKFDRCISILDQVLEDAKIKKEAIDDVVLVGGSTRIPKIQQMVSDYFGGKILSKTLNPDEAVAHGAAVQACILKCKSEAGFGYNSVLQSSTFTKTVDVTPLSIGVRNHKLKHNLMSVVIPKNTVIPCKNKQIRKTVDDDQTSVLFEIFEGEDPIATNNHLLGKFVLNNVPPEKAGSEKIEVGMEINDEGILHVTAVSSSTKSYNRITVSALQGRLSKEQISNLKL